MPAGRGRTVGAVALALLAAIALVPLCGPLDARLDGMLERWRTCGGMLLAGRVSDLVMPIGVGVLCVAVGRAVWRGRPAPLEIAWTLAALGAGVLLVGSLKDVLDRPRPGAEFLAPGGGSFPSGHVANTVLNGLAILMLWCGGVRSWPRWRAWLVLAVATAVVAAARVYGRRHWPSDAIGAVAVAGAYALLAICHPDVRWRIGATMVGLLLAIGVGIAAPRGWKIIFPAGTAASRSAPLEHIAFASAYEQGWLRGSWSLDAPDPQRRSAWLRSTTGDVVIPAQERGVDEVRLVARPRSDLAPDACQRLRVALNGRVLGAPVFQPGWRAYVFPTAAADLRPDGNVLTLQVEGDVPAVEGAEVRQAAFSELTLHGAAR